MSESEEEPVVPKLYKYYLVEFIHRGRRRKVEHIDIVPSNWLSYDIKSKRPITKFLKEPYNDETILMLHSLVRSCAVPPEDWPTFPVSIKGKTDSYDVAMDKLNRLRTESHVLTLESEESFSAAQMKINDALRQRDLQKQADKTKAEIFAELDTSESSKESGDEVDHTTKKRKIMKKRSTSTNAKPSKSNSFTQSSTPANDETQDSVIKYSQAEPVSSVQSTSLQQTTSTASTDDTAELNKSSIVVASSLQQTTDDDSFELTLDDSASKEVDLFDNEHLLENSENQEQPNPIPEVQAESQVVVLDDASLLHVSAVDNALVNKKLDLILTEVQGIKATQIQQKLVMQELQRQLNATNAYLVDKKLINKSNSGVDFHQKYNLTVPFDDMQSFKDFDKTLKSNSLLKCDVCLELNRFIEKECSISKSFAGMLKHFVTKNLGLQFTAARQARDKTEMEKDIFKNTELCRCMFGVISAARKSNKMEVKEKELVSAISAVICNVKKWSA